MRQGSKTSSKALSNAREPERWDGVLRRTCQQDSESAHRTASSLTAHIYNGQLWSSQQHSSPVRDKSTSGEAMHYGHWREKGRSGALSGLYKVKCREVYTRGTQPHFGAAIPRMRATGCKTVGRVGQAAIADPVHTRRTSVQPVRPPHRLSASYQQRQGSWEETACRPVT